MFITGDISKHSASVVFHCITLDSVGLTAELTFSREISQMIYFCNKLKFPLLYKAKEENSYRTAMPIFVDGEYSVFKCQTLDRLVQLADLNDNSV
jgi:hypothetical protein